MHHKGAGMFQAGMHQSHTRYQRILDLEFDCQLNVQDYLLLFGEVFHVQ